MEAQVTVRYLRRVQVAQFEPAEAEASVTATVQEYTPELVAGMLAAIKQAVLSTHERQETPVSPTAAAGAPAAAAPAADKADRPARASGRGRKAGQVSPPEEVEVKVEPAVVHAVEPAPAVEPPVDLEVFQAEVLRLANAHGAGGADAVRAVRAEFGVARIRDIPEDRRGEFLAAVQKRLA